MADPASLAALLGLSSTTSGSRGPADLDQFQRIVGENDYWKMAGNQLGGIKFDTSTWSPGETLGVSALQAFLGTALGAYGQHTEANQLASAASILPELYRNPSSVSLPEDMDSEAFGALKLNAIKEQAVRANQIDDAKTKLFAEVFTKNPALAAKTMPEMVKKFGIEIPGQKEEPVIPVSDVPSNPLAIGRETTAKKFQQYFADNVANGVPATQAATAAKAQVDGEIKANSKSFDDAKAAREAGQKLLDLASTARAGMSQAGQTGSFNSLAHAWENVASTLGSTEATDQLSGDTTLNSIAPELVKMSRSPGAVSDYETKMFLGAGPNTTHTPESNAILAQKMEDLGKLNLDYADFLEAFRDANAGSTIGAGKKWEEYRRAFPIFKGNADKIELNSDRPSWQEYFAGITSPQSTAPDLNSFIAEAKSKGWSKEKAKSEWAAIGGQ